MKRKHRAIVSAFTLFMCLVLNFNPLATISYALYRTEFVQHGGAFLAGIFEFFGTAYVDGVHAEPPELETDNGNALWSSKYYNLSRICSVGTDFWKTAPSGTGLIYANKFNTDYTIFSVADTDLPKVESSFGQYVNSFSATNGEDPANWEKIRSLYYKPPSEGYNYRVGRVWSLNALLGNCLWKPTSDEVPLLESLPYFTIGYANVDTSTYDLSNVYADMNDVQVIALNPTNGDVTGWTGSAYGRIVDNYNSTPVASGATSALNILGPDIMIRAEGIFSPNEGTYEEEIFREIKSSFITPGHSGIDQSGHWEDLLAGINVRDRQDEYEGKVNLHTGEIEFNLVSEGWISWNAGLPDVPDFNGDAWSAMWNGTASSATGLPALDPSNLVYIYTLIPPDEITYDDVAQMLYKATDRYCYNYTYCTQADTSINPATSPLAQGLSDISKFDTEYGAYYLFTSRSNPISIDNGYRVDMASGEQYENFEMPYSAMAITAGLYGTQDCGKIINGADFLLLAYDFMNTYGEPVITDQEINYMLQVYGAEAPVSLSGRYLEAWKYLRAKGCLPHELNYANPISLSDALDIIACIAEPDARTDFKNIQVTLELTQLQQDAGYFPAKNQGIGYQDAEIYTITDYNSAEYYDCMIYAGALTANMTTVDSNGRTPTDGFNDGISGSSLITNGDGSVPSNLPLLAGTSDKTGKDITRFTELEKLLDPSWTYKYFTQNLGPVYNSADAKYLGLEVDDRGNLFYHIQISKNHYEKAGGDEVGVPLFMTGNVFSQDSTYLTEEEFTAKYKHGMASTMLILDLTSCTSGGVYTNFTFERVEGHEDCYNVLAVCQDSDKCQSFDTYNCPQWLSYVDTQRCGVDKNYFDENSGGNENNNPKKGADGNYYTLLDHFNNFVDDFTVEAYAADNSNASYGTDSAIFLTGQDELAVGDFLYICQQLINDDEYWRIKDTDSAEDIEKRKNEFKRNPSVLFDAFQSVDDSMLQEIINGQEIKIFGRTLELSTSYDKCISVGALLRQLRLNNSTDDDDPDSKVMDDAGKFVNTYVHSATELRSLTFANTTKHLTFGGFLDLMQSGLVDPNMYRCYFDKVFAGNNYVEIIHDGDAWKITGMSADELKNLALGLTGNGIVSNLGSLAKVNTNGFCSVANSVVMSDSQLFISYADLVSYGWVIDTWAGAPKNDNECYSLQTQWGSVEIDQNAGTIVIGTTMYHLINPSTQLPEILVIKPNGADSNYYFDYRCIMGIASNEIVDSTGTMCIQSHRTSGAGSDKQFNLMSFTSSKYFNTVDVITKSIGTVTDGPTVEVVTETAYDGLVLDNASTGDKLTYWKNSSGDTPECLRITLQSFQPLANWATVINQTESGAEGSIFVWYHKDWLEQALCYFGPYKDPGLDYFKRYYLCEYYANKWGARESDNLELSTVYNTGDDTLLNSNLPSFDNDTLRECFNYVSGSNADSILAKMRVENETISAYEHLYQMTNGGIFASPTLACREYDLTNATVVNPVYGIPSVCIYMDENDDNKIKNEEHDCNTSGSCYWLDYVGYVYNVPSAEEFSYEDYLLGKWMLPIFYTTDASGTTYSITYVNPDEVSIYDVDGDPGNNVNTEEHADSISENGAATGYFIGENGWSNIFEVNKCGENIAYRTNIDYWGKSDNTSGNLPYSVKSYAAIAPAIFLGTNTGNYVLASEISPDMIGTNYVFLGSGRLLYDADKSTTEHQYYNRYSTNLPPIDISNDNVKFFQVYDSRTFSGNVLVANGGYITAARGHSVRDSSAGNKTVFDTLSAISQMKLETFLEMLDTTSNWIFYVAFYVLPLIMIIILTILVGCAFVSDVKLFRIFCEKFFDPIAMFTLGRRSVNDWKWQTVLFPLLIFYIAVAMLMNANLFRIIVWAVEWVEATANLVAK